MTIAALGALTVGQINISATAAIAQLSILLADELSIQAALTAQAGLSFSVPSPAALAAALASAIAAFDAIQAAAAHVSVSADFGVKATAKAALVAPATALLSALSGAVSSGGIYGWAYSGNAGAFGGEAGSAVTGTISSGTNVNALVLATATPSAWTALGLTVKVTP